MKGALLSTLSQAASIKPLRCNSAGLAYRCYTGVPATVTRRLSKHYIQYKARLKQVSAISAVQEAIAPLSFAHRQGLFDSDGRLLLKNLTLSELEEWCARVEEPSSRARQLYRWLYGSGRWMTNLDEANNDPQCFSALFKAKVKASASLSGGLKLLSHHKARDGTRKFVFQLQQGEGTAGGNVETVLIPMTNRDGSQLRYTACLSSQVGCAMNCQFCFTGRMGLLGQLSTAQIVEQVVQTRRFLSELGGRDATIPINNIVFMGMGEPLHNFHNVMAAIDILADGLLLSRQKIILSTVGLVPELKEYCRLRKAKLAVSLHATTDEVRDWVAPINRRYPLRELRAALEEFFPAAGAKGDNFVVIEYVMLAGVNDTLADAERLVELTSNIYCLINLIVFNPHEGTLFKQSADQDVRAFRSVLIKAGKKCTVRTSKGDDEMAACGQLGNISLSPRPAPMLKPPKSLYAALGLDDNGEPLAATQPAATTATTSPPAAPANITA